MSATSDMKALFIIVNTGFADDVIEMTRAAGVTGATIFRARGEGAHHEMFLGITVDTEKDLILTIAKKATAEKAMEVIKEKAGINTPAHGVCCLMPVDQVVGLRTPAEEA